MTGDSVSRAADALLMMLEVPSDERAAPHANSLLNLIYGQDLGPVVVDRLDPTEAMTEVGRRFSGLMFAHLTLDTLLLDFACEATGMTPQEVVRLVLGRRRES